MNIYQRLKKNLLNYNIQGLKELWLIKVNGIHEQPFFYP